MAAANGNAFTGASGIGSRNTADDRFWSYSVPMENDENSVMDQKTSTSNDQPHKDHQPHAYQSSVSSSDAFRDQRNSQYRNRAPSRDRLKVKRKSSKGAGALIGDGSSAIKEEDPANKWIHRDKLIQIESRELAAMGFRSGRPSRAGSRTKSVRTVKSSVDINDQEPMPEEAEEMVARQDSKRLKADYESDTQIDMDGDSSYDERYQTNGGSNEDHSFASSHFAPQNGADGRPPTRPGVSRIPMPTSSHSAKASEDGESSPIHTRSRSNSLAGLGKGRTRSRSGGSNHLLNSSEDINANRPAIPVPKGRKASNGSISTSNRKHSGVKGGQKSNPNSDKEESPKRPGTSGRGSRPATAKPEGEPPWMANMYKPDPRLPPDQQILPTHARRMAEMQAQAERKAAQREQETEFELVDSEGSEPEEPPRRGQEDVKLPPKKPDQRPGNRSPTKRESVQGSVNKRGSYRESYLNAGAPENGQQWPLRTASQQASHNGSQQPSPQPDNGSWGNRQQANNGEHGGYNLMPNVQEPKDGRLSQNLSQHSHNSYTSNNANATTSPNREAGANGNAANAPVNQPVRLKPEEEDEKGSKGKKKKEGGCGCCVVM